MTKLQEQFMAFLDRDVWLFVEIKVQAKNTTEWIEWEVSGLLP